MVELCEAVLTSVARGTEFSRANPNLARAIYLNMGRSPYFDRAQMDGGIRFLTDFVTRTYGEGSVPFINQDVCARYIFNGATGLIRDWIRTGMEEDSQTMAKRCVAFNLQCASLIAARALDPEVLEFIERWEFEGC